MIVIIVGAGSAALHFAEGCESLGLEYTVVTRSFARQKQFVSRFIARYNATPNCSFLHIREFSDRQFDIGIVATPPISHGDVAEYLLNFGPKLIFIDKPLGMGEESVSHFSKEGVRLLCGSQFVLRPSFTAFAESSAQVITAADAEIRSHYCEPFSGPVLAHPWDSFFADGWITDEQSGGGVLSEFCHALFWVGWLLETSGLPLNVMRLDDFSTRVNGRGRIALAKVAMSMRPTGAPGVSVLQDWQADAIERSLSVTSAASSHQVLLESGKGSDLLLNQYSMRSQRDGQVFSTDRRKDATRLLRHIVEVSENPYETSILSLRVAIWVEKTIVHVRKSSGL